VSGEFSASLKFNNQFEEDEDGNKTVNILDKTYILQLPGDIINYTLEKSGTEDLDAGTIEWTVRITAASDTTPDPTPIDLKGYIFEDDLAGVGDYVAGSFSLSGGILEVPDTSATPPVTRLAYTFPEGSMSPQELTFKTKIPNSVLTAGGIITNTAQLYLDDDEVCFDDFDVTITKPSVNKTFITDDDISGTTYDPSNRTITWYVEVRNEGRTLNNLIITDELLGGLTLIKAQWQKLSTDGVNWDNVSGAVWNGPESPTDNEYRISEKIGGGVDYVGRLEIVTKVPDRTDGSVVTDTYYNQAAVSWTGAGGTTGSAATGNPGVGIGYDALSKSGAQTSGDVAAHQITWTINADLKGQSATGFKIYDLFVHDKNTTNADLTSATGWPSGIDIGSNNITRNNGQKFITVVSQASGLSVTPTELKKGGQVIATLVEITNLNVSASNQVVLKSQVLDPAILAGNIASQKVDNTAALYRNTSFRGQAKDSVNFNNKILAKELLHRDQVGVDNTAGADSINANNRTINLADGFHYGYKEVIFRLNINAAGLDFPAVETNLTGGFGNVTVTDTLPVGWEFAQFSDGQDYLIYNTTGTLNTGSGYPATGSLSTSGGPLNSVSGLSADFTATGDPRTAVFTFTNLDQPYVILVKARPTADTFDGYLLGANTRNETNTLNLYTANWKPGVSVEQKVKVDSTVLEKILDLGQQTQGILTWNVKYTPFEHGIGTGLEDILPEGIDLRTDSSGELIWEQDGSRNINVHPLTLKADGSGVYEVGPELALSALKSSIVYDNDGRKLTFTFPDKTKAYQLTYVTDITGMPGLVSNAVKLIDASGTGTSTGESFSISEQQGLATMGRSGYLVVKKTNNSDTPLKDADFSLYNTNADGTKGSLRAVRTTGSDGTVKFYGLAPGNYILVETGVPSGYLDPGLEYSVVVGSDLKTVVNGSSVITGGNPFVVVNYKDSDKVGSLTISKTVAGDGADTAKVFDFTLTLSDAPGTYTYVGHGVSGGTIKNGDTISLAHGQSITIIGLPAGTTYTVTEKDYSGDGYTMTSTDATGNIVNNTTKAASFTNTRTVGSLAISKTVGGNAGDFKKSFDFTLTLEGAADIPYAYIGNGVPDGTIKSGDSFSLTHGQSITIIDLPAGATYTVTEADYSAEKYTTNSTGATGSIETDTTQTASFINSRNSSSPPTPGSGTLTISKTVAGIGADTAREFNFTITFSEASETYRYVGYGVPDGAIKSGDTISLAHGQSILITGLPAGTTYKVTEEDASADGYTVQSADSSGTISSSADRTAAFTNTKQPVTTGSLTITKTVTGQDADPAMKFDFTVVFDGASGDYPYTGAATGTIRSGDTISLASGDSITITGLPAGTQYTVTEADYTSDGYTTASTGAVGTVSADAVQTASFTNSYGDTPEKTPEKTPEDETEGTETSDDPAFGIGEEDNPQGPGHGQESGIPKTGDNQTGGFAAMGLIFFTIALLALTVFRSRRA
jgi:LPXTG-motif cell wall-anchored protein